MSNFDVSYCPNGEADLRGVLPNIADYDEKRVISGWVVDSALVDRYKSGSPGTIDMLYKDNFELGAAEANLAAVTSDDKWYYDSAADAVYYFNDGDDPNGLNMGAGTDWATLVNDSILRASRTFEAITGKYPIKHRWGTLDYDGIVTDCVAGLAVGRLVRPHKGELADRLEFVYNYDGDEFPKGIMQRIRDGQISLSEEINPALGKGILVESAVDAATTGGIDDIRGRSSGNDTIEVKIINGDTFSYGSVSAVTFSVKIKDETGLMTNEVVTAEIVNGDYQTLAYGLQIRFVTGLYTDNDAWYIKVSKEPIETHQALRNISIRAV